MTTPVESIENALRHHQAGGRIKSWRRRLIAGPPGWAVVVSDGQEIGLDRAEARAFCYALASAEQGARAAANTQAAEAVAVYARDVAGDLAGFLDAHRYDM